MWQRAVILAVAVSPSACQALVVTNESERGPSGESVGVRKPTIVAVQGPPDSPGETRHPSWLENPAPPRPLPTIQIQPLDLTSSVGASPIVVGLNSSGRPVGEALLKALASEIRLYELDAGNEIAITTTIQDVSSETYGPGGYPRSQLASVRVEPKEPLRDVWHVVKVLAVPPGVERPRFSALQTLPNGTLGARFAAGSHPRPSAIRVCSKEKDVVVAIVDWSERINYPKDPGQAATAREVLGIDSVDCLPDPKLAGHESTPSLRFVCAGMSLNGGRLALRLGPQINSPSGGTFDSSGFTGGDTEVAFESMEVWGDGCRMLRPW